MNEPANVIALVDRKPQREVTAEEKIDQQIADCQKRRKAAILKASQVLGS